MYSYACLNTDSLVSDLMASSNDLTFPLPSLYAGKAFIKSGTSYPLDPYIYFICS
jgi:hypothetical protein